MKEYDAQQKVKSRNRLRVERGPTTMKETESAWKSANRKRKIAIDP